MSELVLLLAKLKSTGAERVYFAPNEPGLVVEDGVAKRQVPGGPVRAQSLLAAVNELLSQDDISSLSSTRPRVVRYEHDGDNFVLEIVRHAQGVAMAIRQAAKPKGLRDSVRRDEPASAAPAPAPPPPKASLAPKPRTSKKMRAPSMRPGSSGANKRTVRAEVDEDGNIIDPFQVPAIELDRGSAISLEDRVNTKPALPTVQDMDVARSIASAQQDILRQAKAVAEEVARRVVAELANAAPAAPGARSAAAEPEVSGTPRQPRPSSRHPEGARIDRLLRDMLERKASDLHLTAGSPAVLRVDGHIHFGSAPVASADIAAMMDEIMTERARADYASESDADFAYEIPGLARFRVNVFTDRQGTGAVLRQIPIEVLSAEKLGLPKACLDLCSLSKGLVLVTGPTGSGKSTTLAAMIDFINKNRSDHIITIEDPVEFVHKNQKCLVNQREVGQHTKSFKNALRAALREDPDIVLVGEMRDLETISIAIETAETGHLVFGTLHTTTAVSTVDRIIDQFPADRQAQIRVMLSESLKGVVAQVLCPKVGGGRVAAHEILLGTPAVAAMIREGKTFQLTSVMQTGKAHGMVTMNDSLVTLVLRKAVEPKQAYLKAVDKPGLLGLFKSNGIPFSV
jgi:twitching motility protein PilT